MLRLVRVGGSSTKKEPLLLTFLFSSARDALRSFLFSLTSFESFLLTASTFLSSIYTEAVAPLVLAPSGSVRLGGTAS